MREIEQDIAMAVRKKRFDALMREYETCLM